MSMSEIIEVFDIFVSPNKGVVVGGTNCNLDEVPLDEIRRLVGQFV
jgi:hypothetical protein